jgi:hypothetical protein
VIWKKACVAIFKKPVKKLIFFRVIKKARGKAPEILRVASRRTRSDFFHAAEMVRRPDNAADGRFSTVCKDLRSFEVDDDRSAHALPV